MTDQLSVALSDDLLESIAARMDLRGPNADAVETLAVRLSWHEAVQGQTTPFEGVIDAATGVGKTYILAAAMEYFATKGTRNFAVIAPGRTILDKTVANFTPGHPKSLLGGMEFEPVVITAENFSTPAMRAVMDDPEQVKLFIFTVQALTKPERNPEGRKTHKFQEGLGKAFYEHLDGCDDLIVFADEHHCYYGKAFSDAVRGLTPRAIVGLTATPHSKTPAEDIIFRYPLAAAIADKLVKTPVLVGRKDDRSDDLTKLLDGTRLLEAKQTALNRYCDEHGVPRVNAVMLVLAQSIDEAKALEQLVLQPSFSGGRYQGHTLVVTSESPDEDLQRLDEVEDPESAVRIVFAVNKLKEGWDVKNVYVLASMRASVSSILTEQTLGRGLRLPFGQYTGIELLDTLEVLAHERYDDLLRRKDVIRESFVDHRTVIVVERNAAGDEVPVARQVPVSVEMGENVHGDPTAAGDGVTPEPIIGSVEERQEQAEKEAQAVAVELSPRADLPALQVPRLQMTAVQSEWSFSDITDTAPFRELGRRIAANPADELRRVRLSAHVTGSGNLRGTEVLPEQTVDRIESAAAAVPLDTSRQALIDAMLNAPVAPGRGKQNAAAARLVDAFIDGLGAHAEGLLSSFGRRAADGLVQLLTDEHRRFLARPTYKEVVELVPLSKVRSGRAEVSSDRFGAFTRSRVGYTGWQRSMYQQVWFDSRTERDLANLLDSNDDIAYWVRLERGDLPILWQEGSSYNPDFIAVDATDVHWLIESKADRDVTNEVVQAKRQQALRWAQHVTDDEQTTATWRYLLVYERDIATAKGDWGVLKRLGGY